MRVNLPLFTMETLGSLSGEPAGMGPYIKAGSLHATIHSSANHCWTSYYLGVEVINPRSVDADLARIYLVKSKVSG